MLDEARISVLDIGDKAVLELLATTEAKLTLISMFSQGRTKVEAQLATALIDLIATGIAKGHLEELLDSSVAIIDRLSAVDELTRMTPPEIVAEKREHMAQHVEDLRLRIREALRIVETEEYEN